MQANMVQNSACHLNQKNMTDQQESKTLSNHLKSFHENFQKWTFLFSANKHCYCSFASMFCEFQGFAATSTSKKIKTLKSNYTFSTKTLLSNKTSCIFILILIFLSKLVDVGYLPCKILLGNTKLVDVGFIYRERYYENTTILFLLKRSFKKKTYKLMLHPQLW